MGLCMPSQVPLRAHLCEPRALRAHLSLAHRPRALRLRQLSCPRAQLVLGACQRSLGFCQLIKSARQLGPGRDQLVMGVCQLGLQLLGQGGVLAE